MNKNIYAHTAPSSLYPEYISVNETADPDLFTITIRSKPEIVKGEFVCGHAADKGKPGRCTAGDEHCNNYCNMAPEKGPMADSPLPTEHAKVGAVATITLTMQQMAILASEILRSHVGTAV